MEAIIRKIFGTHYKSEFNTPLPLTCPTKMEPINVPIPTEEELVKAFFSDRDIRLGQRDLKRGLAIANTHRGIIPGRVTKKGDTVMVKVLIGTPTGIKYAILIGHKVDENRRIMRCIFL